MAKRRTTGQVLGERVLYYRKRAGLRQEDLADRTAAIGEPMNRVTIAKIEGAGRPDARPADRTRADNATLIDVLVLALALDVPPPMLFVPLGHDETTELGNLRLHPHVMVDWVCGDEQIAGLGKMRSQSDSCWVGNAQPLALFRRLRKYQDEAHRAEYDTVVAERDDDPADIVARFRAVLDGRLRDLDRHLATMRTAGIESLPKMPPTWAVRMAELRLQDEESSL